MNKPRKLAVGDTIGIVALSSCGGFLFPHRVERGVTALKNLGFEVKVYPCVSKNWNGSAGTPEERAQDLHEAFTDDKVRAIVAAIGGISLNEVLPLLNYDLISSHPKIFCGYSDNTLLHCALATKANLVSFYGPCLITQFGEYLEPLKYTAVDFMAALTEDTTPRDIFPSEDWTDEILDWFQKLDLTRPRNLRKTADGHRWLHSGSVRAPITGGCLSSLLQVKGTEYNLDYEGKILFLDIPESEGNFAAGQSLSYVSSQLTDLKLAGVFSKIQGLIVGRGYGYTDEEHTEFENIITRQTADYDFPVLINVNIGHADPIITLPIGVSVELDSDRNCFRLLEGGVQS